MNDERYVVAFQGANYQRDDGTLYGCFSYYAERSDAEDRHEYVREIHTWKSGGDCLGKWFRSTEWLGCDEHAKWAA